MPAKNGFELQDHDIEILRYVFMLRAATIEHLSALSARSPKALRARLLKLTARRYLVSVRRWMQNHIYALGPEARAVLLDAGYAPKSLAARRLRDHELKDIFIKHLLFMSDIHTKCLLQERRSTIKIIDWQHDGPGIWDHATLRDRNGNEVTLPVRPDAKITLKDTALPEGKNVFDFFLEADRGTMSGERMEEKIQAYLSYHRTQRYVAKYPGMKTFHVLTITATRSRARYLENHLAPILPTGPARRAYRFIAFEDFIIETLFEKKMSSGT